MQNLSIDKPQSFTTKSTVCMQHMVVNGQLVIPIHDREPLMKASVILLVFVLIILF
jgi:hypothetical protein